MSTRRYALVPLAEVSADLLNEWQYTTLTQRAPDASNSLGAGLNTVGTAHNSRLAGVVYLHASAIAAFNQIDNTFDWRDRQIRVVGAWDPTLDVRPGQADDTSFALEQYDETFYSAAGNITQPIGSFGNAVFINGAGTLQVNKAAGYMWLVIYAGTRIKART